uniref:MULE transposase domain-containing protein n=1 Tax=Cajanus cajan TaxID=3821 RepID=A0A151SR71_CAJCA|nr:hypothetical protein KK1_003509 [Cajanus cajan]
MVEPISIYPSTEGMVNQDPSIKISLIQERITSQTGFKISYRKAWMAKQKAIVNIFGDWEESFLLVFKPCCDAFNFCKLLIQVDGTHLYGKYRGTLLIATTQDGNNNVLPLAFVVVEGETLLAWS